jgi:hypothetical protein
MKKIILGLAAVILLGSCDFFVGPQVPVGKGSVTISVGSDASQRGAALPEALTRQFRYEFTFTGPEEVLPQTLHPGDSSLTLSLAVGPWIIEAKAYDDNRPASAGGNGRGILAGSGRIVHTVIAGPNPIMVPMTVSEGYPGTDDTFIPVTGIISVPTEATVGIPLTLTGTVEPETATNKDIIWSIADAGNTGAELANGRLVATGPGTAVVTATITDGTAPGQDYTQSFSIEVTVEELPGHRITVTFSGLPQDESTTLTAQGIIDNILPWETGLTLTVDPANFTGASYQWSLDGKEINGEMTNSLTVAGSTLELKQHQITVQITTADQKLYSKSVTFTVE